MKSDLKQRLTVRIFKTVVFFLFAIVNCIQAQVINAPKDSVRRVEVKVTAKEKAVNYDSIFQAGGKAAGEAKIPRSVKNKIRSTKQEHKQAAALSTTPIQKEKAAVKEIRQHSAQETELVIAAPEIKKDTVSSIAKIIPPNYKNIETDPSSSSFQRPESTDEAYTLRHSPQANKISYLWIGFVLVIGGIVLGLIFGRTAFMVSVVGIVFLIIGFYIGQ